MGSAQFFPSKVDMIGAKFQVSLGNEVLIDVAILLGKKELSFIRALTLPFTWFPLHFWFQAYYHQEFL